MSVNELVVGNLNCVFIGQTKSDLLDFWDEFVSKVFRNGVSFGNHPKNILHEVKVTQIYGEPAVIGRFVKDTRLEINQIMQSGNLVPKHEVHASAPSSVFVYLLASHTILYVGEHPGYPNILTFRKFLETKINDERKYYIQNLIRGKSETDKIKIVEQFPPARISYIPFPSEKDMVDQLKEIKEIRSITVTQYLQNGPFKADSLSKPNQALMSQIGVGKIKINIPKPHNHDGAIEAVEEFAHEVESDLTITASTEHGIKTITNEGMKYRKRIKPFSSIEVAENASEIYKLFLEEVENQELPKPRLRADEENLKKIKYDD